MHYVLGVDNNKVIYKQCSLNKLVVLCMCSVTELRTLFCLHVAGNNLLKKLLLYF